MAGILVDSAVEQVERLAIRSGPNSITRTNPGKAVQALTRLAEGVSKRKTARTVSLNRQTVTKLEKEGAEWLTEWRARELRALAGQVEQARELNRRKLQSLLDGPDALAKTPLKNLAVTQGIYLDKIERLAGSPTAKVQVEHKFGLSDAREWLEKARAARRVVETEE